MMENEPEAPLVSVVFMFWSSCNRIVSKGMCFSTKSFEIPGMCPSPTQAIIF